MSNNIDCTDRSVFNTRSLHEATEPHDLDTPAAARRPDRPAVPENHRLGHELEALQALGSGTGADALPRRVPRSIMPALRYVDSPDTIRYENLDIGAQVIVRKPAPGAAHDEIVVTHLMRGALPRGSGANTLAKVIRDHDDELGQATRLVFWNVQHDTTKAAYEYNCSAANTGLARVGQRVADAIGKRVWRARFALRPGSGSDREFLCLILDLADARREPAGTGRQASL